MSEPNSVDLKQWLIGLRQSFHRIPELNFKEIKTSALICRTLDHLKVDYDRNIGRTGVVAHLKAVTRGPVIAFRTDMDALPISEATQSPFSSEHPGIMHACGHDGHMAIALAIIKLLIENRWQETGKGEIYFIFQPAEEKGAGARVMLETGYFDNLPIQAIFAGHLDPKLPTGTVEIVEGPAHAASDTMEIKITGTGGHGAAPHLCHDPIVAAAYLITALQTLITRALNPIQPAVLTIGQIHSGTAPNIIPSDALLAGTLRTLSAEVRTLLVDRLRAMIKGIEASHQVKINLHVHDGYPVLVNDAGLTAHLLKMIAGMPTPPTIKLGNPSMGAEDFAYFCQRWPGVMAAIGCHDPIKGYEHGLHSPQFQMDENALMVAVQLFSHTLATYSNYF